MKLVEVGSLWVVVGDTGGGATEPFYGFSDSYTARLTRRLDQYCNSIRLAVSSLVCQSIDLDSAVVLDEGKSLSAWSGGARRRRLGAQIRANTGYKRLISQEKSYATRGFTQVLQNFRGVVQGLVQRYRQGRITLPVLQRQTADKFRAVYMEAWAAGRRSSGVFKLQKRVARPTRDEEKWFRSAVREELSYWQNFLTELKGLEKQKGRVHSVESRLDMYVDSVWYMFQSGRVSGLPDTVLLHWVPKRKKGVMCPGCAYMVDHSPFPRDLMPTVPRAGDTPCLSRCVHKVVARFVAPGEVKKRVAELPSKLEMKRALQGFMRGQKYKRKKSKAYNPWLGQRAWGELR